MIGALPRAPSDREELLVVRKVRVAAGVDAVEGLEHLARLRCVVRGGAEGEQALEVELGGGEELLGIDRRRRRGRLRGDRPQRQDRGGAAGQRSGQDSAPGNPAAGRLEFLTHRHHLRESDAEVAT